MKKNFYTKYSERFVKMQNETNKAMDDAIRRELQISMYLEPFKLGEKQNDGRTKESKLRRELVKLLIKYKLI